MVTQEIDLNLIPSSEPVVVHMSQYDEGYHRLICHLYSGSEPYTPTEATVKVQGTKPDKHGFQYYCDIDGSTAYVDVNLQMTACAGRVPTQLIVTESTGVTGTFNFELDVQESALELDVDISETDIPILTEEAQEAARRSVQAAEQSAESAREAAAWSSNPPYIGDNKHWYIYDVSSEEFIDSEVVAEGKDGRPGSMWYRGTEVEGKSNIPAVYPTGIDYANANDQYLNPQEGAIYHCVSPGDDETATWVYDFTLSGGGGGGTDNYNELINKPKIGGVELTGNKTINDLGGVGSFNGRSGSILPTAGDYSDSQISTNVTVAGVAQPNVNRALTALDNKRTDKIMLASTMHIGGEDQVYDQEALDALAFETESLADRTNNILEYVDHMNSRTRRNITSEIQADSGAKLIAAIAEQDLAKYGYKIGDYFESPTARTLKQQTNNASTETSVSVKLRYHLADLDTYYGGYINQATIDTHHIAIVVDTGVSRQWHTGDASAVGYNGSSLQAFLQGTGSGQAMAAINADIAALFGANRLLSHDKLFTTALANWAWQNTKYISALTESEISGHTEWSVNGYQEGEAIKPLALFQKFTWTEIFGNNWLWLRNMQAAAGACGAYGVGRLSTNGVTYAGRAAGLILLH